MANSRATLGFSDMEVIPGVKKQYKTVAGLLNRPDVGTIYVCTDSGREGEYISIPPAIRFIILLHPVHIYQQDTLVIVHYLD